MDFTGPEKRRAKRVAKPFVLRLQKPEGSKDNEWAFIFVKDISRSGLAFRTNDEFREGDLLNLKVSIDRKGHPIVCVGQVVRVKQLKDSEHFFEVAMVFMDLSQEDIERLDRMVHQNTSGDGG